MQVISRKYLLCIKMHGLKNGSCDLSLTFDLSPPLIRANAYAERLRLGLAVIHGEPKEADREEDDRNSPPPVDTDETSEDFEPRMMIPNITPSKKGTV